MEILLLSNSSCKINNFWFIFTVVKTKLKGNLLFSLLNRSITRLSVTKKNCMNFSKDVLWILPLLFFQLWQIFFLFCPEELGFFTLRARLSLELTFRFFKIIKNVFKCVTHSDLSGNQVPNYLVKKERQRNEKVENPCRKKIIMSQRYLKDKTESWVEICNRMKFWRNKKQKNI